MLSGRTTLVGLIGNPVEHSLSPAMHNAAFAARGLDWAYVPLLVQDGRVEDAVRGLVALGFAGANVTAPHKAAAAAGRPGRSGQRYPERASSPAAATGPRTWPAQTW